MEANGAPEKIWVDPASDLPKLSGHIDKDSVEYIRKDAFIEKAAGWLDETLRNTDFYENEIELMVKEFKKAMKL